MKETPDYSNYLIKPIIFSGVGIIPPKYFTTLPYFFLAEDWERVEGKDKDIFVTTIQAFAKEPIVMFETRYKLMWNTQSKYIIQSLLDREKYTRPVKQTHCYTWNAASRSFVEITEEQRKKIDIFKEPL